MRNIVKVCIAMMMVLAMAVPTFATDFVESINVKPSPDLVIMGEDDKGPYYGLIIDEDGNVVDKVYGGDITVTPLGGIDESELPEDVKQLVIDLYEDLTDGTATLEDVEGLLEKLKEALGEEAGLGDLTIRDLFYVDITDPELLELLENGHKLKITFDLGLDGDEFFQVLSYLDQWELAYNVQVNDDGTVTVILNQVGPIAFLTAAQDMFADGENIPATGDTTNILLWAGLGAGAAALLVLLLKRRQDA